MLSSDTLLQSGKLLATGKDPGLEKVRKKILAATESENTFEVVAKDFS